MARKKTYPADKKKHLQFVYLSDDEYRDLCDRLGPDGAADWIEDLNDYLGSKGDQYKSHYWTIRNWTRRAGKTAAATAAGNARLAARAADRVIEALRDPANKTMPQFEPRTRAAVFAVLTRRRIRWPELHEMRHDTTYMEEIRGEIAREYTKSK